MLLLQPELGEGGTHPDAPEVTVSLANHRGRPFFELTLVHPMDHLATTGAHHVNIWGWTIHAYSLLAFLELIAAHRTILVYYSCIFVVAIFHRLEDQFTGH
ncbi:hypothetical protein WG66_016422 [Moniliophthora roreri]|nr:hypothetical protein WG66_016422 [Moniliophthora roreri]